MFFKSTRSFIYRNLSFHNFWCLMSVSQFYSLDLQSHPTVHLFPSPSSLPRVCHHPTVAHAARPWTSPAARRSCSRLRPRHGLVVCLLACSCARLPASPHGLRWRCSLARVLPHPPTAAVAPGSRLSLPPAFVRSMATCRRSMHVALAVREEGEVE